MNPSNPTNNQSPDELDVVLNEFFEQTRKAIRDYKNDKTPRPRNAYQTEAKRAIQRLKATWERQARRDLAYQIMRSDAFGIALPVSDATKALRDEIWRLATAEQPNPEQEKSHE